MGNLIVASACRARSRSVSVYAVVSAQVGTLCSKQRHWSPLQRQCAAQQAALMRVLSAKVSVGTAVLRCWAAAATRHAKAALIATVVWIAKEFVARANPQPTIMADCNYDNVFDEFDAVFEAPAVPHRKLRQTRKLAPSRKLSVPETPEDQETPKSPEGLKSAHTPDNDKPDAAKDNNAPEESDSAALSVTEATDLPSDIEDDYEVLPKPEDDHEFYLEASVDGNKTEGERLLQLASSISDTSLRVEKAIRSKKVSPELLEAIAQDVNRLTVQSSEKEKASIKRILHAFCAYSKEVTYSRDLVATAEECLDVWQGEEDRAFKSLIVLCNDVPRLCAGLV